MLGALSGVYVAFGVIISSISPMLTDVRTDLGATRGQMGLALGAWAFMFILTAPVAGRFIDRFGLSLSIALGGVSMAVSALARAGAQGVGTLWLAVAIFGLGGPLISAGAPTLVTIWFSDEAERRRAVGIYVAAPAVGGVLTLALTNSVLLPALQSWRAVLIAEAAFVIVTTVLWLAVSTGADSPERPTVKAGTRPEGDRSALLRSSGVGFALATAFTIFFLNHGLSNWLPTILKELAGLSDAAASNWVAVSGVIGIFAALFLPRVATPHRRRGLLAALLALAGLGAVTLAFAPPAGAVVAVLSLGVRAALVPVSVLILMNADGVTDRNAGLANGLWFSVGEIGGVSGPLVVGLISDTRSGFEGALLVIGFIAAGTAAIVARQGVHAARRRQRVSA